MMSKLSISIFLAACISACSGHDAHDGHDHETDGNDAGHHTEGPHGGGLIEVGEEVAHLEVIHDEEAGTLTFHVLGPDAKTALSLTAAPELKVTNSETPVALTMTADNEEGTSYSVTDAALKMHGPEGRVTVVLGGKTYNPELLHDHAH